MSEKHVSEATPLSAENAPWSITAVDSQVVTAARELSEGQKAQPDWLWFNHDSGVVAFGRRGGETAAPYVRADLALTAISAARANVPLQAGDDRGLRRLRAAAQAVVNRAGQQGHFKRRPVTPQDEAGNELLCIDPTDIECLREAIAALSTAPPARSANDVGSEAWVRAELQLVEDWCDERGVAHLFDVEAFETPLHVVGRVAIACREAVEQGSLPARQAQDVLREAAGDVLKFANEAIYKGGGKLRSIDCWVAARNRLETALRAPPSAATDQAEERRGSYSSQEEADAAADRDIEGQGGRTYHRAALPTAPAGRSAVGLRTRLNTWLHSAFLAREVDKLSEAGMAALERDIREAHALASALDTSPPSGALALDEEWGGHQW